MASVSQNYFMDNRRKLVVLQDRQILDGSRGAVLQGDDARQLVERCGGTPESNGRDITPADIYDLEQELSPLLAADLKEVRSSGTPHQYYRQYAAGKLEGRDAIFVNGFHETYLADVKDANWQHRVVAVADGGDHYWCAIYVKGMQSHFVTFKNEGQGDGDMHVSFNGEA